MYGKTLIVGNWSACCNNKSFKVNNNGSNPRAMTGTLYNFNQTMTSIRDASNAFRNLTDYLERHPEAILKGKGK